MPRDPTSLRLRTQVETETGDPLTERRYSWARAYRNGEVVCGRVELASDVDTRLGLAARERCCLTVRFLGRLDPELCTELTELVRHRGAVARRAAERMQPIEIAAHDDRFVREPVIGWIQAPQRRHGSLHEIEFGLREPAR